jgi:D-glycero-D-manno-heptose 1,7-bisphosphate phosphatase
MTRRAVFLDRDGVIIEARVEDGVALAATGADAVVIPSDVPAAVARLRRAGYALVVVTNQPDVARGTTPRELVEAINARLRDELELDAAYVCAHDNDDRCACRKPRPGMLLDAAADLELDLGSSWLVGDRWVDIGAAAAAGVRSILLERPYSWAATSSGVPPDRLEPTVTVRDFTGAVDAILGAG